jgi:thiamine-phosphate pyrophosphorylase
MSLDLRLYLVTDPSHADLESIVLAAVEGGVTCVQVRDKHGTQAGRAEVVRRFRDALPLDVAVLVNDDLEVASWADGLHVGVADVAPGAAREALGPHALIGWSINDLAQLEDVAQLNACDYVAVSPVWATPTKTDTSAPFGLDGVREVAALVAGRLPVVGIGGIDASNAADVIGAGADGVCVVSAICGADDPRSAAADLRSIVDAALAHRGVA